MAFTNWQRKIEYYVIMGHIINITVLINGTETDKPTKIESFLLFNC